MIELILAVTDVVKRLHSYVAAVKDARPSLPCGSAADPVMNKIRKETSGERLRKSTELSARFIFGARRFVAALEFDIKKVIPQIAIAAPRNEIVVRRIIISPPLS